MNEPRLRGVMFLRVGIGSAAVERIYNDSYIEQLSLQKAFPKRPLSVFAEEDPCKIR